MKKIFTEMFSDNKYLSILSLKQNHMMEIGSTFQNLQHLGYVDLSFNKIKEVPTMQALNKYVTF